MKKPAKKPRPITAYAFVNKKNPKISAKNIFMDNEVKIYNSEAKCRVEIRFIKWVK